MPGGDGPVKGPMPAINELVAGPLPLLDVTFDQLRTLVAVHETQTPLHAARLLGREHSSIRKQLDFLNRVFQQVCGEVLVVKQGRGEAYLFTPTGEAVVEIAQRTITDWRNAITDRRRRLGAVVTVATTEFTINFLSEIWPTVKAEFTRRGIEVNIVHVRTRDFWTKLDAKEVDIVCGSIATGPRDPILETYDVIEWHREGLTLITNLDDRELPSHPVDPHRLATIPLLAPTAGLVAEFLRRWYGPNFTQHLNLVAEVDSIYYGLALLSSGLVRGALVAAEAVGGAAIEGRLPGGHPGLRTVPLTETFDPPLQLLAGIFARKGERGNFAPDHPLNLLWNAFDRHRAR